MSIDTMILSPHLVLLVCSNLETNLGNRQPEISMHKRTILASESTLDGISSSVSGTGRRDEEIQKLALTPITSSSSQAAAYQ